MRMCAAFLSQRLTHLSRNLARVSPQNVSGCLRRRLADVAVKAPSGNATDLPNASRKIVGAWLMGCSAGVAGAVVLGGVTRLTESGLSITDWHLIRGIRPPQSEDEWHKQFERYKNYPEFKYGRQDMTLSEFKWIFWMEYAHRMYGRGIGLLFYIPAAVFWYKGYFNRGMKSRVLVYGSLLLAQGALGWYMVKSGLDEKTIASNTVVPKVSQYRLAAHLGLAFTLYAGLLWQGMSHLMKENQVQLTKQVGNLKKLAHGSMALVFFTAVSGAFVAGIDGGLVYNSFPKMADRWIPDDINALRPWWKNMFENPTTTQFQHRILGTVTLSAILATYMVARRVPLPQRARLASHLLIAMACTQVGLGISTLLMYVPTPLAATHQFGSLTLLSIALWFAHELKTAKLPR